MGEFKRVDQHKRMIEENEIALRDSNHVTQQQQERIKVLEDEVAFLQIKLGENQEIPNCEEAPSCPKMTFLDLDDTVLLTIFSCLDTPDVLSAAQTCKSLYTRVGILFGIESGVVHESGSGAPLNVAAAVQEVPLSDSTLPVPDKMLIQIDELSKKLSGYELKLILSMTDRLNTLSKELQLAQTEKEDIAANIQSAETVRDFLVDKLKGAEVALKSAIGEITQLKKQSQSDQEIIAYLDLRTNDLETEHAELLSKCQTIQGTMEVQTGSHSYMERLLSNEVEDYKHRLDVLESTFKLQKKVLVKEVKSLRNKMDGVTNERDQYKLQLQKFRDALSSSI